MKRNEAVLVYAVTGVLLLILTIAVIFGGDPAGASTGGREIGKSASASLPGVTQALMDPAAKAKKGAKGDVGGPAAKGTTPGVGGEVPKSDLEPRDPATIPVEGPVPLKREVVLPRSQLENAFGTSEKRGEFRLVKAWRGATLRQMVERWCGSLDQLEDVRALNETVGDQLRQDAEILVPWVDDEALLAAKTVRDAERKKSDWARGELYTLKRGDSLWKVASKRVAQNKIPGWLETFKKLNPEITNLGALVEGQKIRLPR